MTDHQQLILELSRYANQRILVIGDVMLDEYHWCEVSRISPEAPVPYAVSMTPPTSQVVLGMLCLI